MEDCTAALSSLTYAIKAEHILKDFGIFSRVAKLEPGVARRGCEYGISFNCVDLPRVKQAFREAKIPVKRYLRGGGEII